MLVLKPDNTLDYRLIELGPDVEGLRVVDARPAASDVIVVNGLQHVTPGIQVRGSLVTHGQRIALAWNRCAAAPDQLAEPGGSSALADAASPTDSHARSTACCRRRGRADTPRPYQRSRQP